MKAVTEFSAFTLNKAIVAKAALTADGKTPEEIQENLGATFKLEGEKLGCLVSALDVAATNTANLKRILVCRLAEGESAPAKSVQVADLAFVTEFFPEGKYVAKAPPDKDARRGKKDGPKSSPWGLSPEEKAAKNKKQAPVTK